MNTKVTAIEIAILSSKVPFESMTDGLLIEYIERKFKCSKHIAKQVTKKLRNDGAGN